MRHIVLRKASASRPPLLFLRRCLCIAVPMLIFLVLVLFLRRCSANADSETQRKWQENTSALTIVEQMAVLNDCYITGEEISVKGLMLHSVGSPQPSAEVYAEHFNTSRPGGREVCPHAFLQADGTVYQILPWDMYGWHAGGSANRTHIGIEMCEPAEIVYTGPNSLYAQDEEAAVRYVQDTYHAAVELFAALCIRYSLDPLEDGVIISHSEGCTLGMASNHSDPEHLWSELGLPYTMDGFRADVARRVSSMTK